jgi:hypothetical protein
LIQHSTAVNFISFLLQHCVDITVFSNNKGIHKLLIKQSAVFNFSKAEEERAEKREKEKNETISRK